VEGWDFDDVMRKRVDFLAVSAMRITVFREHGFT